MSPRVHVAGAGLSGLAAAVRLAEAGVAVTLHEATAKAGGRCRSFHDAILGRRIDNGSHLILSGNAAVLDYARRIGGAETLVQRPARFAFADLASGRRWEVRVPASPLGLFAPGARPPGSRAGDLLDAARLLAARRGATVAEVLRGRGPMWRSFWEPLTVAVLNAPPEAADAGLLAAVLRQSFLRGAAAARPVLAPDGLGPALVDPALAHLARRGAEVRFRRPLAALRQDGGRVAALDFGPAGLVPLGPRDRVILALPPGALRPLLPDLRLPGEGRAILNAHFRLGADLAPHLARLPEVLGVLGGRVQWLFRRGDVISATVSAAEDRRPPEALLHDLWAEVARLLGTPDARPEAARLLRERAATFDQSPAGAAARAPTRTEFGNLCLAGDHVATGLPATLEGAVTAGEAAARACLADLAGVARPAQAS